MLGRCERSRKMEGRTRGRRGFKSRGVVERNQSVTGVGVDREASLTHGPVASQPDERLPDVELSLLTGAQRSSGWCEGGAGATDAGGRRRSASLRAVPSLQSCSLSPGQEIVLLHNPGPLRPSCGTGTLRSSQRALLCKCVDACGN